MVNLSFVTPFFSGENLINAPILFLLSVVMIFSYHFCFQQSTLVRTMSQNTSFIDHLTRRFQC